MAARWGLCAWNLALDAVWRYPGMPPAYCIDWLKVASEEAQHLSLLTEHPASLGHADGDFDAHDSLWLMARRTVYDVLVHMALVPRMPEARGLNAAPPSQSKLARAGEALAVEILKVIERDEVGQVSIGNHWYRWLCDHGWLERLATYRRLACEHQAPRLRAPFNRAPGAPPDSSRPNSLHSTIRRLAQRSRHRACV